MDNLMWLLGIVCIGFAILPILVYICTRLATIAYLNASKEFENEQKEEGGK